MVDSNKHTNGMKRVLMMVALVATVETMCCRMTYDEIREQLRDGEITIEQAQMLWKKHKEDEQKEI